MIQPAPLCHKGNMAQAPYVQRMMRLLPLLLMAVSLLLASSCRKDDEGPQPPLAEQEPEDDPCAEAPVLGLPPNVYTDTTSVFGAVASPHDPNKVLFKYGNDVVVVDLTSGDAQVILEEIFGFTWPVWGSNDWVLFHSNQGLMKVKSNGDSLTFITGLGGYHPTWHPDGSRYMYTEQNGTELRAIIRNRNDEILDTLPRGLNTSKVWVSDNMLWYSRGYYLINEDSLVNLAGFGGAQTAAIDEDLSYSNSFLDGLFTMRKSTGEITQILDPYPICNTVATVSYSPLRNQLLANRGRKYLLSDGRSELIYYDMIWLNMDGSIHEVIDHRPFLENL